MQYFDHENERRVNQSLKSVKDFFSQFIINHLSEDSLKFNVAGTIKYE